MTHDDCFCLLIELLDEIASIQYYQKYLTIALDQYDSCPLDALDRMELLVSTYLSRAENSFDQIKVISEQLKTALKSVTCVHESSNVVSFLSVSDG